LRGKTFFDLHNKKIRLCLDKNVYDIVIGKDKNTKLEKFFLTIFGGTRMIKSR